MLIIIIIIITITIIQQGTLKDFNFHPRCSKTLIQGVESFSSSSGLFSNNIKSKIYLVGVSDEFREFAANNLDLSFKSLPVKYLGMPLTSKHYSAADCEYLVDKMTTRIRTWHARNLSYLARLQLVTEARPLSSWRERWLRLTPFADLTFGTTKQNLEP